MTGKSDNEKIKAGMEQMNFEMVDNGVMKLPTSKPATYTFSGETTYRPDVFADAIDEHEFSLIGVNTKQKNNGVFYYYADVVTDHYKKVAVKVWNNNANLYPKEKTVDTYELSRILHAIENAFKSELEHKQPNNN